MSNNNNDAQEEKQTTTRYTIDLPDRLHHEFKIQAAMENRSMKDVMIEALETYLNE
jgi:plasmid stability protein